ncbi:MAG: FtsQ-type POTRA domain-containing protein [Coriobacteriales bacterium]|jgi:cell division protein FtsQ|nr:FtsQ-type POTRA domain-containing protein [Coriobacteriales bacterium]
MASNSNQRSDSSGSPDRRRRAVYRSTTSKRYIEAETSSDSLRRRTVDYEQGAQNDLQKQEHQKDRRMRNARMLRQTDSVRVLEESRRRQAERQVSAQDSRLQSGQTVARVSERSQREQREQAKLRREQRTKSQSQAIRYGKAYVFIAAIIVVLLAGAITYFSPAFTIKTVEVDGDWYIKADHLTEIAQVPIDTTLLRVDTNMVAERVAADPWVASATVSRKFPATLRIVITERQPVAVVYLSKADRSSGKDVWLLASDGTWLGELYELKSDIQGLDNQQLIHIDDVDATIYPQAGSEVEDPGLINAIAIINGFSSSMRTMVSWISAPNVVQTTLYLNNNVEVAFGAADDINIKEAVINELISKHGPLLLYINIRVADRPTIRLADN